MNTINSINIINTAQEAFLSYSKYVILDRALPDVRDGLKPVHRRILYAMCKLGMKHNTSFKKSARVVGDVIGKYHPHGDTAVYEAMVRMAQDFSMRLPLVDGQGNFGSVDGDSAAAMRYTEARLTRVSEEFFEDINHETVDYVPNYDETETEPEVLPIKIPNLIINGIQGIAVGMASNIPPHNPDEALEVVKRLLHSRLNGYELSTEELLEIMPAPDFPTGGLVYDLSQMPDAVEKGYGRVMLRSKWHEEEVNDNHAIVITEIPYQVNKTKLIEDIHKEGQGGIDRKTKERIAPKVEGIKAIRDESDKDGIRLVIEVSKDEEPEIVFGHLCKNTQLEISFNYNCTVIKDGAPKQIGLREIFDSFIDHRLEVIYRRTVYLDNKARERLNNLEGILKALADIDEVIKLIKSSQTPAHALVALMDYLEIDEDQAKTILEMKLHRLTSIKSDEIKLEAEKLEQDRAYYAEVIGSEEKRMGIIISESDEVLNLLAKIKFGDAIKKKLMPVAGLRRSEIAPHLSAFDRASMTVEEDCVVYLSDRNYVRRLPVSEVSSQNRGTRGKRMMKFKQGDSLKQTIAAHSHDCIMAITDTGRVFGLMSYDIPTTEGGRHINNLIDLKDEKVIRLLSLKEFSDESKSLVMMTKRGLIKRTQLSEYKNCTYKNGLIGIKLNEDDAVVQASIINGDEQIMSIATDGSMIRYEAAQVRKLSRGSKGSRSQKLNNGASIVYADVLNEKNSGYLVTLTQTGMAKVSALADYPERRQGNKGFGVMKMTDKTGQVLKALWTGNVEDFDLGVVTKKGVTNRIGLDTIRVTSRMTQGVIFMKPDDGDAIVDCFLTDKFKPSEESVEALTDPATVAAQKEVLVDSSHSTSSSVKEPSAEYASEVTRGANIKIDYIDEINQQESDDILL